MDTGSATDRPNVLVIMADEHAPQFSGFGGHPLVQTPNLDRLAAEGVVFEHAYCNSPLCVPSRMSFMTGRYVHHNPGGWDNSSALSSDAVTWAHRLRAAGYDAVLAGKQHFVGPDQLHGFRSQLARDLHAGRAHGTFDWSQGTRVAERVWPGLAQAGPGTTEEIEVDDAVEAAALTYLRDSARKERPWALNVGFIAPHFPLVVPQRYWDLYPLEAIDLPTIPPGHLQNQHPVYRRMRAMFGLPEHDEAAVRRGRAAYYGLITYLDEKVGRLLDTLDETGQRRNTLVVYTSDHGEMAGEHGMWRKSNFYEHSVRVPLIMSWPGAPRSVIEAAGPVEAGPASGLGEMNRRGLPMGRRVPQVVSLVDVVATMVEVTGAPAAGAPLDGDSLLPLAWGTRAGERAATGELVGGDTHAGVWKGEAFSEYLAHGVARPMAMLRRGRWKLNYSLDDAPELYDLETDPGELHDLAADPTHAPVREALRARLLSRWDPVGLERRVRQSQQERLLIHAALHT